MAKVLVFLPLTALLAAGSAARFLVRAGSSPYAICLPPHPHPAERYAAEELERFIEKSTGARLPILSAAQATGAHGQFGQPLIILGRHNPLTSRLAPDAHFSHLGEDGFILRAAGPHLIIAGATPRGTLYGAYWFLREHIGCRWYAADTTYIPRRSTIRLPRLNETHRPRFRYRECLWPEGGDDGDFAARMMLNGQLGHRTYARPLKQKHGGAIYHVDAYNNEARPAMSPETRRLALETCRRNLSRFPRTTPVYAAIDHVDGGYYFTGGEDARMIREGGSPAAPLMDLTAWLARKLAGEFPNVIFIGSAYLWSRRPCTNVRFPDNAGVAFAPIEADWSKPLDHPANRPILQDLDSWCRQTRHVWVWLYFTNFTHYLQPLPDIYPMARTIRVLASRPQVEGIFLEGAYNTPGMHLAALKAWVFARHLWDPDQDVRKLVREFVGGYYGPAAPFVMRYIDALHRSAARHPSPVLTKSPPTLPYLNARFLIYADNLMRQAEEAARENELYLKHIRLLRMCIDYVCLINAAALRAEAEKAGLRWAEGPGAKSRLERFRQEVHLAGVKAFGEGTGRVEDILAALSIPRRLAPPPPECRGLPDSHWVQAQDISFRLADATIVADPKASDGGAARMPGNTSVWGIQYPLQMLLPEEGQWDIYAEVRIDPGRGKPDDTAMLLGIDPGPHIQLRLADLADGRYHAVKLPGGPYSYNAMQVFWAAPPNSKAVRFIYVDRVFAIRR